MSNYRVHVEDNFINQSYRLYLLLRRGDLGTQIVTRQGMVHPIAEGTALEPDDVFAEVPYDAAHAVLAALGRVLGAVEHPEQLRHDFEHERGRVDKLIDHLHQLAVMQQTGPPNARPEDS